LNEGLEMPAKNPTALTPASVVAVLEAEYGAAPWRPHGDAMAELILTVLSQNTSDVNSGRAFTRLLATFPDWKAVMLADVKDVERAIEPGGLAPTKAPRIQAILRQIAGAGSSLDLGFLRKLSPDEARDWLRSLPGVGPKTAACVQLFALGQPALPVDTHVDRVAKRLGLVPQRFSAVQAQELLERQVPSDLMYPFHIQLIKHGRRTCTAQRPECPACPLRQVCPSAIV
jgi:endonuclease-3